jgi:nucleoside-diphosphate-sugar epimerase
VPVFVTGASGFLGGRLAQILQDRGEEVVVLARPTSDLRHLSDTSVRVVRGDLSDRAALAEAVKGVTHIFHCAACSTDWARPEVYVAANVTGTENLLEAALQSPKLERFVHVSTTDIYGYPQVPCSEEQPFVDAGLPYNSTKGRGEQAVWNAYREHGLPIAIVRPATIFGPRGKDFTLEVATMLRQRMMITIDGGSAPGGFTYVDNVVEAMLAAALSSNSIGQAYNVSDGTGATWLTYLGLFAERLQVPKPWLNLSFSAAMGLARILEAPHRYLKLGGRPLLTVHAVHLLGIDQEFPIEKAVRDLDFRPAVSLEEGIDRSVAWLRDSSRV